LKELCEKVSDMKKNIEKMKQQILKIKGVKSVRHAKENFLKRLLIAQMRHKTGSGCIFRGIKRREQKENNTEPENRTRRKTVPDVIPNVMRKVMWKIMLSAARKLPERTRKKAAGANAR